MPLHFESNAEWPPKPYDQMAESMHLWSAWWSGNTDYLADYYSQSHHKRNTYRSAHPFMGGKGNEDVYFWGRPNSQGTKRRHVSTAASVARASSGLLFSRPPRISPGPRDEKNAQLANRMDYIFGPDAYGGELHEAGELCSALGGVYLRPWWDKEVVDHVVPSHVSADSAIPEFRFGRLVNVTFWSVVSDPGESPVMRYLERHEKGMVYHGLYAGTEGELGERVDLDAHHSTAWAAKLVDEDGGIKTGLDRLDVVYVPNVGPNRTWHNIPGLSPLGRSDFDGIESEFDALDEVHTSWMRDVEDGKSRLFVEEELLADLGPGKGGAFDQDKHVYTTLRPSLGAATDSGAAIQAEKFDIRWAEHAQTSAEIKQHILEHVGMSSQHFADGPLAVGVTATEVNSNNNITETTRAVKINFFQRGLTEFVDIVMRLDEIHFKTGLTPTDRPAVRFTSQHNSSEGERASVVATKVDSKVISKEQAVKELNPDWTQEEVDTELERIMQDAIDEAQLAFGEIPGEGTEELEGGIPEGSEA